MRARLRTTLLAGLVALNLAVVGSVAAMVYGRARAESREALHEHLRLRAKTMAGLLEIGPDGPEFDVSLKLMPEYERAGSGSYLAFYDADGKPVLRSPSLGRRSLPHAASWTEGAFAFDELESGPDEIPSALVTYSFVVQVEKARTGAKPWEPPPLAARRHQIVVATDSRPRSRGLTELLVFLGIACAAELGVTVLGGLLIARRVLTPIRQMTADAAELTPADASRRLRPDDVAPELVSLATTLNSALDRLGDALDRQRRFVSDASHELRTPLAVLLGNAELLLRRDRTADEYRKGLARQARIARRMTRITENLLVLARADDGRNGIERMRVALATVVREVCDEIEPMAAEGGVALTCEADDAVEVAGDAAYLDQLVQNLAVNAVKFTAPGGTVRVRLGASADGSDAVLEVSDTGSGIAPERLPHVFERFYRVADGKDPREGAGLGLAIVDWIVRAHGGRIAVRSEVGRGTAFEVRLPLVRAAAPTLVADGKPGA